MVVRFGHNEISRVRKFVSCEIEEVDVRSWDSVMVRCWRVVC